MWPQHLLTSAAVLSTAAAPAACAAFANAPVPSGGRGFAAIIPSPSLASRRQPSDTIRSGARRTNLHFSPNRDHGNSLDERALEELEGRISEIIAVVNDNIAAADPFPSQLQEDEPISLSSPGRSPRRTDLNMDEAASSNGMPWTDTFGKTAVSDPLLYMPFWTWQLDFMRSTLTDLHPIECHTTGGADVSYKDNPDKRARIVNQCYASDEYRKIRMTYYDAGDSVQVFNSVWYPDPKYNLPILGIDLLSFNRKKYLAIVDFQPLHEEEADHARTYEDILRPIKDKYESLKGRMSSKFYDETQFFSNQMLFARFEDGDVVEKDLFPAYRSYVEAHVDLVNEVADEVAKNVPEDDVDVERNLARQRAYDTYSAERDPAASLFASMFGKEWAEDFIYDFLFSLSERADGGLDLSPPKFGGGGGGGGGPPPPKIEKPQALPQKTIFAKPNVSTKNSSMVCAP